MQKKFPLKDLGRPQKFLGLYFETIPKGVRLHLEPYIEELLERFHLTNLPIAHAPAPTNRLIKKGKPVTGEPKKNYRAMLGAVLWIAVVLRGPDIGFSVIQCARFCAEPTEEHWKALLRLPQGHCEFWARLRPHSRRGKVATQGLCGCKLGIGRRPLFRRRPSGLRHGWCSRLQIRTPQVHLQVFT